MTMGFQSGDVFHHEGHEEHGGKHEERLSSSFMVFVLFVVDFFVGSEDAIEIHCAAPPRR